MSQPESLNSAGKSFATLKPRACHVTAGVIRRKWRKPSITSQESVRDILGSVRAQSRSSTKKGKRMSWDADALIEEVTTRLSERVPRMPLPPTTNDETLDFELTLHRIQNLEQQLTGNIHSISLLNAQIRKEEQQLEADTKEVNQLQESFRSSDTLRRQQSKNVHPLIRRLNQTSTKHSSDENTGPALVSKDHISSSTFDYLDDPLISPMIEQLRSHLESLQANTSSIQEITRGIQDTKYLLSSYEIAHQMTKASCRRRAYDTDG